MSVPTPFARFHVEGYLAFLTIDRPDARHAMTWEMYEALVAACDAVDARDDLRVLIVRSTGDRAFIAGTDISQFSSFARPEDAVAYERHLDSVVDRLERVRVPTIAQVQGVAAGGGCAIALACDLRVCGPDARFGMPIARTLGNCLSAANCARLMDAFGAARLKDIVFTARMIDVGEAQALGLVNQLVALPELDAAVRDLASTIASHAPLTLRATKETIRRIQADRRLEPSLVDDLITLCYTSADFREGIEAFLSKRRARFTGH